MYNYKFLFFALVFTLSINGQNSWQQNANYKIYIDIDVNKNTFKGSQEVLYTNNSPDTLNKVFFHLYFNAFRPELICIVIQLNFRSLTALIADEQVFGISANL